MTRHWLGLAVATIVGLVSAYYAAFFAWVTATPLDADGLHRAQRNCYAWFAVLVASLIVGVLLVVRIIRQR